MNFLLYSYSFGLLLAVCSKFYLLFNLLLFLLLSYYPLLRQLHWLPLKLRINFKILLLTLKALQTFCLSICKIWFMFMTPLIIYVWLLTRFSSIPTILCVKISSFSSLNTTILEVFPLAEFYSWIFQNIYLRSKLFAVALCENIIKKCI